METDATVTVDLSRPGPVGYFTEDELQRIGSVAASHQPHGYSIGEGDRVLVTSDEVLVKGQACQPASSPTQLDNASVPGPHLPNRMLPAPRRVPGAQRAFALRSGRSVRRTPLAAALRTRGAGHIVYSWTGSWTGSWITPRKRSGTTMPRRSSS